MLLCQTHLKYHLSVLLECPSYHFVFLSSIPANFPPQKNLKCRTIPPFFPESSNKSGNTARYIARARANTLLLFCTRPLMHKWNCSILGKGPSLHYHEASKKQDDDVRSAVLLLHHAVRVFRAVDRPRPLLHLGARSARRKYFQDVLAGRRWHPHCAEYSRGFPGLRDLLLKQWQHECIQNSSMKLQRLSLKEDSFASCKGHAR